MGKQATLIGEPLQNGMKHAKEIGGQENKAYESITA